MKAKPPPSLWCVGVPPQPPHVTDGGMVNVTSVGPDVFMGPPCWSRWVREVGDA